MHAYLSFFVCPHVYDRSVKPGQFIVHSLFQVFINLLCHLWLQVAGWMFTEVEILRMGNNSILNNIDEGVVIIDEKSNVVQFVNSAAKLFKIE